MRYRDHKGGLEESLNTTRNIYSESELLIHLNKEFSHWGYCIKEICFKHVGLDSRINWDTYYVLAKQEGDNYFMVVGMSDSNKFN